MPGCGLAFELAGTEEQGMSWEGFNSKPPDPTAVGMKRADSRDLVRVCACGSTQITIGEIIKG